MEDINQLELTAYIIVVSREISNYNDKTIDNYIDLLEDEMLKTSKRAILTKVRKEFSNRISPRHSLNLKECINYAKLIFKNVLIHPDRNFTEDEIIDNSEYIYVGNSPRNAEEKVIELGL